MAKTVSLKLVLREFKPHTISRHAQIDVISTLRGGKSHIAVMLAYALQFKNPHVICAGTANAELYANILGATNNNVGIRRNDIEGADAVIVDSLNYDRMFMKSLPSRSPVFRIIAHPTLGWSHGGRHCDYTIIPKRYYSPGRHVPDKTSAHILDALPADDHLCLVVDHTAQDGKSKYWWYRAPPRPTSEISPSVTINNNKQAASHTVVKASVPIKRVSGPKPEYQYSRAKSRTKSRRAKSRR
jgi:hypothetical protein